MKKTWIIPDIHGCAETLAVLLEQLVMPNKTDHLIFLGDYIDRGPDSKNVIKQIMDLQKNNYNVTLLMGNHEDYCIKAWDEDVKRKGFLGLHTKSKIQKEWELFGGEQTLDSFDAYRPKEIPEKYIIWMRNLKYFVELNDFVVVHAGLNFKIDDPFSDKQSMIWIRDYKVIPKKIKNRRVIHGHVPVNLEFIDLAINNKNYNFIDIDNGVYMARKAGYGNLLSLEVNNMEYVAQPLLDEVTYKNL